MGQSKDNVVGHPKVEVDQLFLTAEKLSKDFSLFPDQEKLGLGLQVEGLLSEASIEQNLQALQKLQVDEYIEKTVLPAEDPNRPGARAMINNLNGKVIQERSVGQYYCAEIELDFGDCFRRVGFIAQDRTVMNGAWMPEHHDYACEAVRNFADLSLPIVSLIDTPGADAGEAANSANQAHSISRLIAEMSNVDVPTLGIIVGIGYSGGAIPLANSNILLSVRDGIFNTIQPKGLANIARKYNLSWQECAKSVGVAPEELYRQGCIDGIIDFTPNDKGDKQLNFLRAIVSSVKSIELGAQEFVKANPYIIEHYQRSIARYLEPSDLLSSVDNASSLNLAGSPTVYLNVFGISYRYLRYLTVRKRVHSISIENYGRLAEQEVPKGDLSERIENERQVAFNGWLRDPDRVIYDDQVLKQWKNYLTRSEELEGDRGAIAKLILGEPRENYEKAKRELFFTIGIYLYNRWKVDAQSNFHSLIDYLQDKSACKSNNHFPETKRITLLDILLHEDLREDFVVECQNVLIFDYIYNDVINNLVSISQEANRDKVLSRDSVDRLLENALQSAIDSFDRRNGSDAGADAESYDAEQLKAQFKDWLKDFVGLPNSGEMLKIVEDWKSVGYPQLSDTLFVIVTFFFEKLLPEYYRSEAGGAKYKGVINPVRIGRRKDFWNRLTIAYHDLLIQEVLKKEKAKRNSTADAILGRFVDNFTELNGNVISANPVNFPGFRISIEAALDKGIVPCGVITGVGDVKLPDGPRRAGILVSNVEFQAGAFDMASAEKFCKLLVECAVQQLPVVCFVTSGGMQTKEGAGALFSMAIVNDRVTRFVRDNELPIIVFGFGDCTGGAQASFVTHPLVQTYYFSGTNMPFAGQMVVPAYLPSTATLSNYLSRVPGAMQGMVKNPFSDDIDAELRGVDASIPIPSQSVENVLERALEGYFPSVVDGEISTKEPDCRELMKPIKRTLIHARGCTAVKLIRKAQEMGIEVVLVASDPDMDSVPVDMLGENDRVVCIGGNTSDESYLNAHSVLKVAEYEEVDSLHPGIGFLAENSQFAALCTSHHVNFIGPSVYSMNTMGNKSNAINTALRVGVPVVPGSHGILTSADKAASVANEIGYPVLIKAVHGGGGKGIQVVERAEDIQSYFHQVSAEAKSAFGNGDIYLEKYITSLRHIEVQVLRDQFGNTKVLGLRDCSVQRNNQKVVEESASTMLPENLKQDVLKYTQLIADEVDYIGAGTVEFIYNLDSNSIYFMEMNTRLQVEHPVTEWTSGVDIVAHQFKIASGESIENLEIKDQGYAIEVRITAEKAALDANDIIQLLPDPGYLSEVNYPQRDYIEVISMADTGKTVSPFYDSLIAQVICYGSDRNDAVEKLVEYLGAVTINGICTNIPLLRLILQDKVFVDGEYSTTYLPELLGRTDKAALIDAIESSSGVDGKVVDIDSLRIEGTQELKVVSRSTGIFYSSASPSEPDFVKPGDVISVDQTLALMEAMKVYSPVTLNSFNKKGQELYSSSKKYKVERVNNSTGTQIASGDLLFVVSPV
ncbi:MAG: carbamoyl-phosphate synthase large subunit [Moraxellaceae bacterium]|nr:MAG: carbamoyl-phosphate synthase large subunit [Moraxellaceae bacterium]